MPAKRTRFWFLVCDGGRAQVYAGLERFHALSLVEGGAFENEARGEGADRSGERATGFAARGGVRHGMEEHGDPGREEERAFLGEVLAWVLQEESHFDRLVVIAPPRALGEIRKLMPPLLQSRLEREVGADLTKMPVAALSARIMQELGW